jgi:hypothetical protein
MSVEHRFSDEDDWAHHLAHHFSEWFEPTREANNLIEYNATVNTGVIFKLGLCPFFLWDVFSECHGLDQSFHQYGYSFVVALLIHHWSILGSQAAKRSLYISSTATTTISSLTKIPWTVRVVGVELEGSI